MEVLVGPKYCKKEGKSFIYILKTAMVPILILVGLLF
jgi:hypothetical protein